MKTKFASGFVLAATLAMGGLQAQPAAAPSTSPTSAVVGPVAPAPNQVIYVPRLPSVTELTNAATAQGLSIEKIEQTAAQVTVTYKAAAGQTNAVAYQLLPTAGMATAPVVVEAPPRVVYYEPAYDRAYDPWYWYPPVSFRLGVGYGFRGGSFHGGFRHWR